MSSPPAVVALIERSLESGKFAAEPLEAMAARLWLAKNKSDFPRADEALALVMAFWNEQSAGEDRYWSFLSQRSMCAECGERYRIENLSVCPNCFNLYCSRESRVCDCGGVLLG